MPVALASLACLTLMPIMQTANADSNKAFMDANQKMMQHMQITPTGDADKDFVSMMIPHHEGAVDMATIELQFGKDPELRALAQDIIEAQKKEIAFMKKWAASHP